MRRINILAAALFISLASLAGVGLQVNTGLESPELSPVLKRRGLTASAPRGLRREVAEIEEADSRSYAPVAGTTFFLQASSQTRDSEGMRPRYWLRVEDYATEEMAERRAREYISTESYERVARAYGKADSFMVSKLSVRLWAVARGRRVYALTTDAYLFTLIELPKSLRRSILALPKT